MWSPSEDPYLREDPAYTNYDLNNVLEGKAQCKAALQAEMGLPIRPSTPVIGFIGRLDCQKGVDLIQDIYGWLMDQDVQLIMLGSGRSDLEVGLREMEEM